MLKSLCCILSLFLLLSGCSFFSRSSLKDFPLTVAFGSCIHSTDSPIWSSILAQSPDLLLLLGDNVYFSDEDLALSREGQQKAFNARYEELFSDADFARLTSSVPTFAIWDDHDFGPNNSDGSFASKDLAIAAFSAHFGRIESRVSDSRSIAVDRFESYPGMARSFLYKGVRFILTDNRWYRKNATGSSSEDAAFFGERQLEWLEQLLAKDDVPLTVLVAGGQLLAQKGIGEELRQYPEEFARLLSAFTDAPRPVIILSGDRHYSEILQMRVGKRTPFELTSSPLTASPNDPQRARFDPSRVDVLLEVNNFAVLTVEEGENSGGIALSITYFSPDGEPVLQRRFHPGG